MDSDPEECFIDQLDQLYPQISISVVEGLPRGHGISSYIGYIIKVKTSIISLTVERRYSQFAALRECLVCRWPAIMIPPLPAKHASGSNSLKVVNERIKYLTYFLNNCSRFDFIFMSDQFQLFLTSTDPDIKRLFQKIPPLPFIQMLHRYQQAFPEAKPDQNRKAEVATLMRDQVEPFLKQLQGQRITLINLKREIFKLSYRRQEYLRTTKVLFSDTLPSLELHLSETIQQLNTVILQNQSIKDKTSQFRQFSVKNYWIVYEGLKLQILQSQAMIGALQSKMDLSRQQQRLIHDILVNEQQLLNIQAKKLTLKQFFSKNNQELSKQLQKKNSEMKAELQTLKILNMIVAEMATTKLIGNYYKRREQLWKNIFSNFIQGQKDLNNFMESYYKLFLF